MLTIIDPRTGSAFPSTIAAGRHCFAIPFGSAFAVKLTISNMLSLNPSRRPGFRAEAVIAVDGRDTLSNQPASPALPGIVISADYTCPGFQIGQGTAATFVHMPKGQGLTTAERNGTPDACGLVAAAVYRERSAQAFSGVMRGVTRSAGGAMAGADVANQLGQTAWERGDKVEEEIVEYDTREGWAARGILIQELSGANPWPGAAPQFASRAGI